MKKILVATDSFKGSISSRKMIKIFKEAGQDFPNCEIFGQEIADGGEGTIDALVFSGKFRKITAECSDPLGKKILGYYAVNDDVAVIESAVASGLTLIEYADGNAMITTTYGVGELIADAVKNGAKHVFVAVGGTATNDGGIGALTALGYKFVDENGKIVYPCGKNLCAITDVIEPLSNLLDNVKITIMADVDNAFVGKSGATMCYGKQKGAVGEYATQLENGMLDFADLTERITGVDLKNMQSAGAGGGLAGGLIAYLGADVQSGISTVLDLIDFDNYLSRADVVITGEGKIDEQSFHGKAVFGIVKRANSYGISVYAIAGCTTLSKDATDKAGLKKLVTLISDSTSIKDSIDNAEFHAKRVAEELLQSISTED